MFVGILDMAWRLCVSCDKLFFSMEQIFGCHNNKNNCHFFFFQWYIQGATATQGTGLYEGLDWLSAELSKWLVDLVIVAVSHHQLYRRFLSGQLLLYSLISCSRKVFVDSLQKQKNVYLCHKIVYIYGMCKNNELWTSAWCNFSMRRTSWGCVWLCWSDLCLIF